MHLWGDFLPTLLHSLLPLLIFLICASWCRCEPVRGMSCTTKPSIASCRHPQPVCVIHMCMQNEHSPSQCLNAVRILEQGDALSSSECLSGANTMSNPVEHCMHTVACAHTHAHTHCNRFCNPANAALFTVIKLHMSFLCASQLLCILQFMHYNLQVWAAVPG